MDKVSFFNQVLQLLGDREYKVGTPGSDACDLWFTDVMREALRFGSWSFATEERVLKRKEGESGFILPQDCLRLTYVGARRFMKHGRRIFPEDNDMEELTVRYVSDKYAQIEHVPEMEPRFVQGVRQLLAARIVGRLEGDIGRATQLESVAWESIEDALHDDVVQFASNDQHPLEDIINQSITL